MEKEKGKLYICATPIGNLGDITPRVLDVLREADLIAAEDTRNSIKLLNHFEIKTPMTSYHEFNKYDKAKELVAMLLDGKNIAVITDAGTPCISDPGEELVKECVLSGIEVTSLPGASAVITALSLSGLSTRRFVFEGFLPPEKHKKERLKVLERLKDEERTIVLYEAPHRLKTTLTELSVLLGADRRISLCRELTKKHEEIIRTTIGEALSLEPRGEYVLCIEGKSSEELEAERRRTFMDMELSEHMDMYLSRGLDKKEAMKAVAKDRGLSKRDIYNELNSKDR